MSMRTMMRSLQQATTELEKMMKQYNQLTDQHNILLQIIGAYVERQEGAALLVPASEVFAHDVKKRRIRVRYLQGDSDFVLTMQDAPVQEGTGPQLSVDTTDVCVKHAVRKLNGAACPQCQAEADKVLLV